MESRKTPPAPLVRPETLGAWLLKRNADRSGPGDLAVPGPWTGRWCLRPGYRASLMAAGQPALGWVSGGRGGLRAGVWAVGRLAGSATADPDGRLRVPVELEVLAEEDRVDRADLRADPRLGGAEVLRQPQAANPSFLTVAEWRALADHLPHGPERRVEIAARGFHDGALTPTDVG